jgi:hypothetical protein
MTLQDELARLAALRVEADKMKETGFVALAAYRALPEYVAWNAIVEQQGVIATEIGQAERMVHELTLAAFKETGDKAPAPGVSVKLYRRLKYGPELALQWARTAMPALIREVLDVKAFERVAQALGEEGDCWTTEYDPRPTIAGDLSAYLPMAEDTAHGQG